MPTKPAIDEFLLRNKHCIFSATPCFVCQVKFDRDFVQDYISAVKRRVRVFCAADTVEFEDHNYFIVRFLRVFAAVRFAVGPTTQHAAKSNAARYQQVRRAVGEGAQLKISTGSWVV